MLPFRDLSHRGGLMPSNRRLAVLPWLPKGSLEGVDMTFESAFVLIGGVKAGESTCSTQGTGEGGADDNDAST